MRTAVFQGLKFLLAQAAVPAVVPAVKACLTDKAANIAALINDGSERVRASLLDLLIELRKIKAMHWHNFVGKEELLRRLPLEGKANQQRCEGTRLGHGASHTYTAP